MPSEDEDILLARQLQSEFDEEAAYHRSLQEWTQVDQPVDKPRVTHSMRNDLSIVDPFWELNDPIPDIRGLFREFDSAYFWGKLGSVEVKWSPRMTHCAGVCSYEGRGGLVSVRLSEPLLKLRPRKDLVETLLHEMIHAFLFVTRNFRDHDAHGEEFHKHMNRINAATGAKITVYHTFHDEVANYRVHWWRCTGPCTQRKPYYGMVKRAMNRPPSPRDPWWADHQSSCGGTFVKIKEPEPKLKRKRGDEKANEGSKKLKDGQRDLYDILSSSQKHSASPTKPKPNKLPLTPSGLHKPNVPANVHGFSGNSHKPTSSHTNHKPNVPANVHGFNSAHTTQSHNRSQQIVPFMGKGHTLGGARNVPNGRPWTSVSVQSTQPRQPTLADFLDNKAKKAEAPTTLQDDNVCEGTNRHHSGNAMKFLYELLSSESEGEEDAPPPQGIASSAHELETRLAAPTEIRMENGWSQPSTSNYSSLGNFRTNGYVSATAAEISRKVEYANVDDDDDIMMWVVRSTSELDTKPNSSFNINSSKVKTEKSGLDGGVLQSDSHKLNAIAAEDEDAEMLSQGSQQHQDEPTLMESNRGAADGTVICPVCHSNVPQRIINQHLDTECFLVL